MTADRITIVHTRGGTLLSKRSFTNWRSVQDEFDDYMTSLGPFTSSELVEYLLIEYPAGGPFPEQAVRDFIESDSVDLWSGPTTPSQGMVAGALRRFEETAIEWAGTGYGAPLVDAAVAALMEGLDTPTLRVLAGAPMRFADEESSEHAPSVFEELGLSIQEKHSSDALIALAKLKAQRFLEGVGSARTLSADLWMLYVNSGYQTEIVEFSGIDDWYLMLDDGVIQGHESSVDDAVREAARYLVAGEPGDGSGLRGAFMGGVAPTGPKRWERFRRGVGRLWTGSRR